MIVADMHIQTIIFQEVQWTCPPALALLSYNGAFEYRNTHTATAAEPDFEYNSAGMLIKDRDKGISRITYNNIGLVDSIFFDNGARIAYVYSMTGEKLKVAHWTAMASTASATIAGIGDVLTPTQPRNIKTTEYIGGDIEAESQSLIYGSTYKYHFGNGYVRFYPGSTQIPKYYYYTADHLGNIRSVVTKNHSTNEITEVQQTHYYPFGGIIADLSTGRNVQNHLYNGKELDYSNNLWWYDYGARQYDPTRGQFTTPDPLAEKYYPWNYYAYCMNNPINAIDPDGNLIIFVNGWHPGFYNPKEKYWSESLIKYARQRFRNEGTIFYDGSLGGGLINTWTEGCSNLKEEYREQQGYNQGLKDVASIINMLKRDRNGKIMEAIHIISHSMGGAYSKGLAEALVEYAMENPDLCDGLNIAEYDLAPFQPDQQSAVEGVDTYQFSHKDDLVAGDKQIKGATYNSTYSCKVTNFSTRSVLYAHTNDTFAEIIKNLPEGRYVFRNGEFVKVE